MPTQYGTNRKTENMKRMFETITGNYSASARVVDGTLILSYPDAITPIVWQMELGNTRASALEVRQNDETFVLALKTPRGDVHDIAPFATRARAVNALMAASRAMAHAHGQLRTPNTCANTNTPNDPSHTTLPALYNAPSTPGAGGKFSKILSIIIAITAIIIAINVALSFATKTQYPSATSNMAAQSNATGAQPAAGTPMSADDYLKTLGQ